MYILVIQVYKAVVLIVVFKFEEELGEFSLFPLGGIKKGMDQAIPLR